MSGVLTGVVNNPRATWLQYFGLPEDMEDWTLQDMRASVSSYVQTVGSTSGTAPTMAQERVLTVADFQDYMQRVGEPYRFMEANRLPAAVPDGGESEGDGNGAAAAADANEKAHREQLAAELANVPEICFQEDFDLSRPETFAHFLPPDQPHSSMVMMEKLNGYLDAVELTLLDEVKKRSDGFFEALQTYDVLNREVAAGRAQIDCLRTKMRALETNLVHKSIRLPTLVRRRANTAALLEKQRLVHTVWTTQPIIKQLLSARDFPGALELISSSQQLLSTELKGVVSLRKLGVSLAETKRQVTSMMSKDLMQLALGYDLDAEPPTRPKEALASELEARMVPLANGLLRLKLLQDALSQLEAQLETDMTNLIKRSLQEGLAARDEADRAAAAATATAAAPSAASQSADSGTEGTPASPSAASAEEEARPARSVTAQVKELSVEGFEEVMGAVASNLMILLRRANIIHHAIQKALYSPGGQAAAEASSEGGDAAAYISQNEARSAQMLRRACEHAQKRFAKVVKVRKEVHSRMRLADFMRVHKAMQEIIQDIAHLCPAAESAIALELTEHAKEFLKATDKAHTEKLEAIVEQEKWKQADVAPQFQEIVDAFARNQVPSIAEAALRLVERENEVEQSTNPRQITFDGLGFKVVGSSLLLVSMAANYMQCVSSLGGGIAALVAHLLPALLRLFNTTCFKQVLCAGAMRADSAGLKQIASRHLALAAQSLAFVHSLIPHFKAILAAYVADGVAPVPPTSRR
mmetsp:Transcript_61890/g.122364  ORF Transcript_61890/g.122364 Transcript_61890/m.122364 type:complete len:756 (-) Transcript_61890:927-3194(-)